MVKYPKYMDSYAEIFLGKNPTEIITPNLYNVSSTF